ncbi:class I SAM-dependent methyltransferase [Bifidobacterium simiarum]|nr:class I SAM-dependent methyltransferase [Bifidobacterium simiarum]
MERTRFHGKAQVYDQARPGYPQEAVRYVASLMPAEATVSDVGAGTGKFTVSLAASGVGARAGIRMIYAVEPDSDMRTALAENVVAWPNVTVVDGSAAHTTLPDDSVDVITCAQSLHWFDHDEFLKECARIGRGGRVLLISLYNVTSFDSAMTARTNSDHFGADLAGGANGPSDSDAAGTAAAGTAALAAIPDVSVSGRHFRRTVAEFFDAPTIRVFPNPIRYTRDGWRAYMDSHSHSPLPNDPGYAAFRTQVDAIFDMRAVDGIMTDDTTTMIASEWLTW